MDKSEIAMNRKASLGPMSTCPARSTSDSLRVGESASLVIERLYDRHKDSVFRLALRYGRGDVGWAEDVTHDVFLDLFDFLGRLEDLDDLAGWFYRVTTNRCLNRLKRQHLMTRPLIRLLVGGPQREPPDPEQIAIARSELKTAFDPVNGLPPKERVVFFMRHVDGLDQVAIARALQFSEGYVSKLLQRATRELERAGWQVNDER